MGIPPCEVWLPFIEKQFISQSPELCLVIHNTTGICNLLVQDSFMSEGTRGVESRLAPGC